jgi:ubiquinone/menaquinone biosynthesis C-methylase UbiE
MMMAAPATLKSAIRDWWASNPMTYGAEHGVTEYTRPDGTVEKVEIGTRRFFELADETFYSWNPSLHDASGHFGSLFDYRRFRDKAVLEIGCGMGCMAMNWAQRGARVTAVDLNPVAVHQTTQRFKAFNLLGDIREADAELLPFPDASFDFVYSWGVLHHTLGTRRALAEVYRVLKPGGCAGIMLYNRQSLLYWYIISYLEGLVNLEAEFLEPLELASRYSDGDRKEGNPHTWPVTRREVRRELMAQFADLQIQTFGTDVPWILDHWYPGLASRLLPHAIVEAIARRFGWSLWITGGKPAR